MVCVDERDVDQLERDTHSAPPTPPAHFPRKDDWNKTTW